MLVFISHSRQNSGAALKLCERLQSGGVKPWLDLRELDGGDDWAPQVAKAVRSADGFIFLIGPPATADSNSLMASESFANSSSSGDRWQRYEWGQIVEEEYYLDPAKPLVPVLIGDAEIPGFLKTRQAIRVPPTQINFDVLASQVQKALQNPADTIDQDQMERGRVARQKAQESLLEFSRELEEKNLKQAAIRGFK